jgi:hypothetical protein
VGHWSRYFLFRVFDRNGCSTYFQLKNDRHNTTVIRLIAVSGEMG